MNEEKPNRQIKIKKNRNKNTKQEYIEFIYNIHKISLIYIHLYNEYNIIKYIL